MVLQQDTEVTIWGWANAQEKITLTSSWNKKKIKPTLTADGVAKPITVRYLWNDNANATIFNSYGLPAVGFRTDDWVDARYKKVD